MKPHAAPDDIFRISHCMAKGVYGVATIRRLLKMVGLFLKEPYERDDILQKRPII